MGRPKLGSNIGLERALTSTICSEVHLRSGLTMAQLESVFGLGTVDGFGVKTSKTFSRYCEADPAKSRAAPRDVLQRIVKVSLERGWFDRSRVNELGLNDLLMLGHKRATEIFEERKKERDALVKSLRELRAAVMKTLELNTKWKYVRATKHHCADNDDIWHAHLKMRHAFEFESGVLAPESDLPALPDEIAPTSLNGCLQLLSTCLDQTSISFWTGETATPQPDSRKMVSSQRLNSAEIDFSDIEALLREVKNSMKSKNGAILVQ